MSKYSIRRIDRKIDKDYIKWKDFLLSSIGGTIFHDPDFLSYHGDRFDEHHLGVFKGEELCGLIPLAIIDQVIMQSPYGASYGGFIFKFIPSYSDSMVIVSIFIEYAKSIGINKIILTPSLPIYHIDAYSDTFMLSLLENHFKIINSNITSIVSLDKHDLESKSFTSKLRNMVRKAEKSNISIKYNCAINVFWTLMDKTFDKHKTKPTHTQEEYVYLCDTLKNQIYCHIAYLDDLPIAGIGLFEINKSTIMSFYLCSDSQYQQTQALSLLVSRVILDAQDKGFKYFDFGTSSINMVGNASIFRFKESFGAFGQFRHVLSIDI